MVKRLFSIIFALILFTTLTNALTIDIKNNYQPGETAIVKISGEILSDFSKENVEFKRGYVRIPLEYDAAKIAGDYYVWFIAPSGENNYSLNIQNIVYTQNGKTISTSIQNNFSVSGNMIDYSITPGFIDSGNKLVFHIKLNEDSNKKINIDFPEEREINLMPGDNKIEIPITSVEGDQFMNIQIGHYSIPGRIRGKYSVNSPAENIVFESNPGRIKSILLVSENNFNYPIQIKNSGNGTAKNIILEYNKNIFSAYPQTISAIEPNQTYWINLTLRSHTNNSIEEFLGFRSGEFSTYIPIEIAFTNNDSLVQPIVNNSVDTTELYCSEIPGLICSSDQICSENSIIDRDGKQCCLGLCKSTKSNSSWSGYLLILIVVIAALGIYYWYKKKKDGNYFEKRIMDAEKRR